VGPSRGASARNGVLVRARAGYVGVDASFGFLPLLAYTSVQYYGEGQSSCNSFTFEPTAHATLSALVFFTDIEKRLQLGLGAGGAWNSFLRWGGQLEFEAEFRWRRDLSVTGGIGLAVFPGGSGRIAEKVSQSCSGVTSDQVFPQGTLEFTLGFGLLYYFL